MRSIPSLAFNRDDKNQAFDDFGFNCGPGAFCAATGFSIEKSMLHFPKFMRGRAYVKETDMRAALDMARIGYQESLQDWPDFGLVRVLFEGPWTSSGNIIDSFYRSHWIATAQTPEGRKIFDINAMLMGGWIDFDDWSQNLAPWLAKRFFEGANGKWRAHERFFLI